MIELVTTASPELVKNLAKWLDEIVRPHLTPDVSNYAKGRLRVWLGTEPTLTSPTRLLQGLPTPEPITKRLADITGWPFDFCLATYSGDTTGIGIGPHRDASYADYEATSMNVTGESRFSYWEGRHAFGYAANTREFDPKTDAATHTILQTAGQLIRFNCKNLHAAEPGPKRWSLNFWRQKPAR
jgi:hypothetical protein